MSIGAVALGRGRAMASAVIAQTGIANEQGRSVSHPGVGVWMAAELTRLCDVEDLLDWLEMHGVTERELHSEGPSRFVVRWWQPEA